MARRAREEQRTMPRAKPSRVPLHERRYFKEIAVLLLVKTCLIVAIRFAFFAKPEVKPDPVATTAAHLLAPAAATTHSQNSPSPSRMELP